MRTNRMKLVVVGSSLAAFITLSGVASAEGTTGTAAPKAGSGHDLQSHTDANTARASEAQRPNLSAMMNLSEQQTKALQQELKNRGVYAGRVDGILGDKTREALRKFQTQHGLSTREGMTDATADALGINWDRTPVSGAERDPSARDVTDPVERQPQVPVAAAANEPARPPAHLKLSRLSAEQGKQLQQRLQDLGFYRGAIDGVIGSGTRKAMARFFQHQAELAARGIADDATIFVLGVERSEVQPVSGEN